MSVREQRMGLGHARATPPYMCGILALSTHVHSASAPSPTVAAHLPACLASPPLCRRVLWLSVSTDLRKDAERDLADVGCRLALFPKVLRGVGRLGAAEACTG